MYTSAGQPTASIIEDDEIVVDYKLFWVACKNTDEANFLLAVINSNALQEAVRPLMSKGQFGARDLQKHLWKLPIPEFDPAEELHASIAEVGAAAAAGAKAKLDGLRKQRGDDLAVTIARRELRTWLRTASFPCYADRMARGDRQLLDSLSRMPFIDSVELVLILGEPHSTVHRALTGLLADGIVGRVSHGTAHLPSSQRYHLTAKGVSEAAEELGFETPSDFMRAYPMSREWLTLLIRRMDAVAAVYRLASSMSPGTGERRSYVEFHRRGRFDATVTLHDGRSFGLVRQGLALRRRSLYDRLRAIAEYDYTRRPDTILILVPSVWEQRLTGGGSASASISGTPTSPWSRGMRSNGRTFASGSRPRGCSEARTTPSITSAPRAAPAEGRAPSRRSANAPPYPALSGWWRLRRPSASHLRRSGHSTSSPTTR